MDVIVDCTVCVCVQVATCNDSQSERKPHAKSLLDSPLSPVKHHMKFLKSDLYEQPSGGELQKQGGEFETLKFDRIFCIFNNLFCRRFLEQVTNRSSLNDLKEKIAATFICFLMATVYFDSSTMRKKKYWQLGHFKKKAVVMIDEYF